MKMNKLWLSIAIALASPLVVAGERVNETRDAAPDGHVRVTLVRGDLEIEGWDKNMIEVRGELDDQMEEFIFDVSRGDAIIEVKLPRNLGWNSGGASDLEIKVPRGSSLDISGVSTNVSISDINGSVEVGGVSGDIDLRNIADRLDATTVSGDVDARDVSGRVSLKSVSGDIDLENGKGDFRLHSVSGDVLGRDLDGELDLESVSGSIEIIGGGFTGIRGHTVSGDVDINSKMARGATVELDSVSGTIRLEFVGGVDARFDLETGSGSIRNRLSSDRPNKSKYVRDETLRFVLGRGDGEVLIGTRSGDIVVER